MSIVKCGLCHKDIEIENKTTSITRVCRNCYYDKNKCISAKECKIQNIDCSMAKKYYYTIKTVCYDVKNLDLCDYDTNYLTNDEILAMNHFSKGLLKDRIKFIVDLIVFNKLNRDLVIENARVKKYIEYGIMVEDSLQDFANFIISLNK